MGPERAWRGVNRVHETDERLIDAIDEQYGHLFDMMQMPYAYWRRYAFELIECN